MPLTWYPFACVVRTMKRFLSQDVAFGRGRVRLQLLLSILFLAHVATARAQEATCTFVSPSQPLAAGRQGSLWLYCMNDSSNVIGRVFERSINCTLVSPTISLETVLRRGQRFTVYRMHRQ